MRKIPVPKSVTQLPEAIKMVMAPDELLSSELWDIIALLADLQGKMTIEQPTDKGSYMQSLEELDHSLKGWASRLPPSWRFNQKQDIKTEFDPCHYSTYPSHTIATVWNHYRIARCLIQITRLDYLHKHAGVDTGLPTPNQSEQITELESTTQTLCNDICATVPYFLQQTDEQGDSKPGIGAFEVVWPLFFCASITSLSSEQRLWARRKLYEIGSDMGIPMARQLADVMKPIFTAGFTE
jgi:hypothetical protein